MARKPKAIEIPGDTTPAQYESLATPEGKAQPQPEAAPRPDAEYTSNGLLILERRAGWILTQYGWTQGV
ncbi:hypothetical protein [Leclercia sp. Marseille-Q4284]|uniref:hypothetical protein n=1 Tax=Leclercia sp. Marseille-Q4284 TaxID=2866582 RepID=UPI001CE44A01|nr:hypothetical protein [Leclercia sp. Marseille-Q4284]